MKTILAKSLPIILMAIASAGCASTDPVRVEDDFGTSVHQMIDAQIYDPATARAPRKDPPVGMDGVHGETVLKTYRDDVGKPDEVREDVHVGVSP